MARGRRSTVVSGFVYSELATASSSSGNEESASRGNAIGGSSTGLGCLRNWFDLISSLPLLIVECIHFVCRELTFLVEDGAHIAKITMFDEAVEALFGYPVEDFVKMKKQLSPTKKIKDPFADLLKDDYKILFKFNHLVDKRGTICSIIAEGVEKIGDHLNKETISGKRRYKKKKKVENQDLIIEEKKNTSASAIQLTNDTKGKEKQIEAEDDELLSDYLKRIRQSDATKEKAKTMIGKVKIKKEK